MELQQRAGFSRGRFVQQPPAAPFMDSLAPQSKAVWVPFWFGLFVEPTGRRFLETLLCEAQLALVCEQPVCPGFFAVLYGRQQCQKVFYWNSAGAVLD